MKLIPAGPDQLETVYQIVTTTIEEVYPHYYPSGAVAYFLRLHQREQIRQDIKNAAVYLGIDRGQAVATCTVRGDELCRLFVLPAAQGQGYGSAVMEQLEALMFASHDTITLAASLPALSFYQRRGYQQAAYVRMPADNNDYLCYWTMELHRPSSRSSNYATNSAMG